MQEKPVSYFLGWTRLDTEHNQLFLVRCTILIYWIILLSVVTCRLCCEAVMHSLSSTPFCRLLECACCAVWLYSSSPGRLLSKNHVISSAVGSAFCRVLQESPRQKALPTVKGWTLLCIQPSVLWTAAVAECTRVLNTKLSPYSRTGERIYCEDCVGAFIEQRVQSFYIFTYTIIIFFCNCQWCMFCAVHVLFTCHFVLLLLGFSLAVHLNLALCLLFVC